MYVHQRSSNTVKKNVKGLFAVNKMLNLTSHKHRIQVKEF